MVNKDVLCQTRLRGHYRVTSLLFVAERDGRVPLVRSTDSATAPNRGPQ